MVPETVEGGENGNSRRWGEEWVGGRGSSTWVAVATLRCSLGGGREGLVKGAGFPLGVSSREGLPQFKQKLAPW